MQRYLLIMLVLLGSTSALAQEFNYNYIDIGYVTGEIEDIDADGYGLDGSLAITENVFFTASYGNIEPERYSRLDVTTMSLGLGIAMPMSGNSDLILAGRWINSEVDLGPFGDYDDDGLGVEAGIRTWLTEGLEFNANVEYADFGGSRGGDVGFNLGLIYNLTGSFGVGVSGSWSDDPDSTGLGVNLRFNF